MADSILWNLVTGFDPLGQRGYSGGLQQYQNQQNILQQLAGQDVDRQLRRDQLAQTQRNADRQFGLEERQFAAQRTDSDRNYQANRSDTAFNQADANRKFGLQERIANDAQITQYEMPDGSKVPIRVDRQGNVTALTPPSAVQRQPINPYAPNGKMTDGQANAALYANRMAASHLILDKMDNINNGTSGQIGGFAQNTLPAGITNNFFGPERQQAVQAQRDFLNAVLRRESGAVISDAEFANARQQYFPQPGDSQQVIEQKRQNRINAIQGIMGAAGSHYRPPIDFQERMGRMRGNGVLGNEATTMLDPPQPNQSKVQINSQAEYNNLPSGSLFIMNGKSYQKP